MQIDNLPFLQNKLWEERNPGNCENSAVDFSCLQAMLNRHKWNFKESEIVLGVWHSKFDQL